MQKLFKSEMICAGLFILNGMFLLVCPLIGLVNFGDLFVFTMLFYAVLNVILLCLNLKTKDYTSGLSALACLALAITSLVYPICDTPKFLAIALLVWTMFLSLIKLKKADRYHDKKSKMWLVHVVFLILFILTGILTSINFLYEIETQILVFGYFILITGIFEFIDPFVCYLTRGKL